MKLNLWCDDLHKDNMPSDTLDSILPSIHVHDFPESYTIDIGGSFYRPQGPGIRVKRVAYLECAVCLAIYDFYSTEQNCNYDIFFCPGGQPPEITHTNILGGEHSHPVPCAGISAAHFHVKCSTCESVFLLGVPKGGNR